jgi:hypothetical protein
MPARVRSTEAAQVLVLGAALRLETPGMATDVANSQVGVETLSWVLPERARAERIRLGVALFSNGIEFSAADGAEKWIELPKSNPALISVRWRLAGTEHRQLKTVAPGVFVETGTGADSIEIVTLAGESYSLSASMTAEAVGTASGSSTAKARPAILQNAPDEVLPSCILVEPLGSNAPPKIAFPVGDGLWITAGPTQVPFVGTVGGSQGDQFEVLNRHDERAQLAILRPLRPKSEQSIPKADPEPLGIGRDLMLLGFQGEMPRRFSGRFDPYDGVTITDTELPAAVTLLGAPVILDGRLLGILAAPKPKLPPNQRPMTSGDADLGDFVGETPVHWRFLPISAIEREIQALAGRQANVTGQATQRAAINDHGASSACVRIGAWPEGGPTAFAVEPGFLVTYGNENLWLEHRGEDTPPEDLSREGDPAQYLEAVEKDYEIVGGTETVRKQFLLLQPKSGLLPQRSLSPLTPHAPEIAGLFSGSVPVIVLWHDRQGFRPVSGQARWNDRQQQIEVWINDMPDVAVLHVFHEWPDKVAGSPVLVNGKLLGMVARRDYVQEEEPVLALVEAWKIGEAFEVVQKAGAQQRRVFISYSKEDSVLARRIAAALRAQGLIAHEGSGDLDWIRTSELVVALVTRSALASKHVREEWSVALENKKRMLPVVLSPLTLHDLPRELQGFAALRFGIDGVDFDELIEQAASAAIGDAPPPRSYREGVKWAQQQLRAAGYGTVLADGDMGPLTRKALMAFQRSRKLPEDGQLTPQTVAALDSIALRPKRTPQQIVRPRKMSIPDTDGADRPNRSTKRAKAKKKKPKRK